MNGQRALRRKAIGIEAIEQLVSFGAGQNIQCLNRFRRCLFKRVDQPLHGAGKIRTNTSGIDAFRGQRSQVERLAQIIDAERQRIAAALARL